MIKKYHMEERVLLNKESQARAYIVAVVEDTREIGLEYDFKGTHAHIEFRLADCIEEIALEFDLGDRAERENSLYKAKRLVEIVSRFRDALEIEVNEIEGREAVRPLLKAMSGSG